MMNEHKVNITARDMALMSWWDSMELVRRFQNFSDTVNGSDNIRGTFAKFAEEEAEHASKFLEIVKELEY